MAERQEAQQRVSQLVEERDLARAAAEEAERERQAEAQTQAGGEASLLEETRQSREESAEIAAEEVTVSSSTDQAEAEVQPAQSNIGGSNSSEPQGDGVSWRNLRSIGESVMGTGYVWGGSTPSGFDCSGFTQWVFAKAGVSIPRNSAAQYAASKKVSNPQPGDLVFFGQGRVTHVGIYAGGGRYLGSQTSTGVAYTSVHGPYWGERFIGYGRF